MDMILMQVIIFGALGSIPIYYFTYGNWPLAFKLQIALSLGIGSVYVALFNIVDHSSSRDPNHGFGVVFIVLLFGGIVIATGLVSIFYWGKPAGPPGRLSKSIKWISFVVLAVVILSLSKTLYQRERYRVIYVLPDTLKRAVYSRLMKESENYDYDASDTLEFSVVEEAKDKKNLTNVLLLTENPDVLRYFMQAKFRDGAIRNYYRDTVLAELIKTYPQTKYPSDKTWQYIVSNLSKEKPISNKTLLLGLEGLKLSGGIDDVNSNFYNDFSLVKTVWEKLPVFRYGFWPEQPADIHTLFEMFPLSKTEATAIAGEMAGNISVDDANAKNRYDILMETFSRYGQGVDYSKGVLYSLTGEGSTRSFKALLNIKNVPDSAWRMKFYSDDLLNYFIHTSGKVDYLQNPKEDPKKTKLVVDVLKLFKSKGVNVLYLRGLSDDITAKYLKKKFGIEGFVDKKDPDYNN